jgi:hypothetical protein
MRASKVFAHLEHLAVAHRQCYLAFGVNRHVGHQDVHVQRRILRSRGLTDECRGKHFAGPTRRLGIIEFASSVPATRETLEPLQFFLNRGGQFASAGKRETDSSVQIF